MNNYQQYYDAVYAEMKTSLDRTTTQQSSPSRLAIYWDFNGGVDSYNRPLPPSQKYMDMAVYIAELVINTGNGKVDFMTQVKPWVEDFLDNARATFVIEQQGAGDQNAYQKAMEYAYEFIRRVPVDCPFICRAANGWNPARQMGRQVAPLTTFNQPANTGIPGSSYMGTPRPAAQQPLGRPLPPPVANTPDTVKQSPTPAPVQKKPDFRVTDDTPYMTWFDPNVAEIVLNEEKGSDGKPMFRVRIMEKKMDMARHLKPPAIQPVWVKATPELYATVNGIEREKKLPLLSDFEVLVHRGTNIPSTHESIVAGVKFTKFLMDSKRVNEALPHLTVHSFTVETPLVLPVNQMKVVVESGADTLDYLVKLSSIAKCSSYRTFENHFCTQLERALKGRLALSMGVKAPLVTNGKVVSRTQLVEGVRGITNSQDIANCASTLLISTLSEMYTDVVKNATAPVTDEKTPKMSGLRSDTTIHVETKLTQSVKCITTSLSIAELRCDNSNTTQKGVSSIIGEDTTPLLYSIAKMALEDVPSDHSRVFLLTSDDVYIEFTRHARFPSSLMGRHLTTITN